MCSAAIVYNLRQICCLQMYRVHRYILYMANKTIICGTCKYDQKDLCMRGIYSTMLGTDTVHLRASTIKLYRIQTEILKEGQQISDILQISGVNKFIIPQFIKSNKKIKLYYTVSVHCTGQWALRWTWMWSKLCPHKLTKNIYTVRRLQRYFTAIMLVSCTYSVNFSLCTYFVSYCQNFTVYR